VWLLLIVSDFSQIIRVTYFPASCEDDRLAIDGDSLAKRNANFATLAPTAIPRGASCWGAARFFRNAFYQPASKAAVADKYAHFHPLASGLPHRSPKLGAAKKTPHRF